MPAIHCDLRNFATVPRPSPQDLTVSEWQLLRTATIVGIPTLVTGVSAPRPLLEMQWRLAMVAANLSVDAQGRWTRSAAYDRLDPSEKVAVSYFLGMVQAELTATLALGYTHLVHVDVLLKHAKEPLLGQRPDFVALNISARSNPIFGATVEAKGRTNAFDVAALAKAKDQARAVPMISGVVARETVASEAFFNDAGAWSSVLEDPDWQGQTLEIGIEQYLLAYYSNIIESGRDSATWRLERGDYRFEIPGYPLSVRVPAPLVEGFDRSSEMHENEREESRPLLESYWALIDSGDATPGNIVTFQASAGSDLEVAAELFMSQEDSS